MKIQRIIASAITVAATLTLSAVPAVAEAVPSSVSMTISSNVPSLDGSRCDATFVGTGLQASQPVNLEFEGNGKTNKGSSIELAADADGQMAQTVNTVGTPMVGNGTYWVKLTSSDKVLAKAKVVFRCGN